MARVKPPSFLILMGPYSIVPLWALALPRATQIEGMAKSKERDGIVRAGGGTGEELWEEVRRVVVKQHLQ